MPVIQVYIKPEQDKILEIKAKRLNLSKADYVTLVVEKDCEVKDGSSWPDKRGASESKP